MERDRAIVLSPFLLDSSKYGSENLRRPWENMEEMVVPKMDTSDCMDCVLDIWTVIFCFRGRYCY